MYSVYLHMCACSCRVLTCKLPCTCAIQGRQFLSSFLHGFYHVLHKLPFKVWWGTVLRFPCRPIWLHHAIPAARPPKEIPRGHRAQPLCKQSNCWSLPSQSLTQRLHVGFQPLDVDARDKSGIHFSEYIHANCFGSLREWFNLVSHHHLQINIEDHAPLTFLSSHI